MKLIRSASASVATALLGSLLLWAIAAPATAQEVTVLCNFEVDWCEALKTAYEKTTGQKAVFIRRTDGESLAQIRAEKGNPRADVVHAAESASAKALAAEGLPEPARRAEVDGFRAVACRPERRDHGQQVPDPIEQECAGPSAGAQARRGKADQARPRQIRLEGRPRASALALGKRGLQGAEVSVARWALNLPPASP